VLLARVQPDGYRLDGTSVGVEDGAGWSVEYEITVDGTGRTRAARVTGQTQAGKRELLIEGDGDGGWLVDGAAEVELQGCMDVDLEASAFTNALPVRRLRLEIGERSDAPAVYVRAADLRVERLEQRYARLEDRDEYHRFDYSAPRFGYKDVLTYDEAGLIVDYPGLAVRVA
jgi:hypothetical protein